MTMNAFSKSILLTTAGSLAGLVLAAITVTALSVPATRAQEGNDGLAVRIMKNDSHVSSLRWYRENIPADRQGSPAETSVDGYPAVRDGRSVYVNAGNGIYGGNNRAFFYTNMYILSHTQEASSVTTDIFGQMLQNWTFNTNLLRGLTDKPAGPGPGQCRQLPTNEVVESSSCYTDAQCGSGTYCDSVKAKVRRDVVRLADWADLKTLLEKYKTANNNAAPQLSAGTYLQGKTISVWPSWQQTLGAALGAPLPVDPLNRLWSCANSATTDPNGDGTCWDEKNKVFTPGNSAIPVPVTVGYVYSYSKDITPTFTIRLETEAIYQPTPPLQ